MDKVVYGGKHHNLQIEPTVLDRVDFSDPIMQEEIFGPVMPILTYSNLDVVINKINSMPSPLALYIFTNKKTGVQFLKIPAFLLFIASQMW